MTTATFPMQSYFRPPMPLSVETSQKIFDDDENRNVLDENILDQSGIDSGLEMSPPMADSRRESFTVGPSLFSPKTEAWESVEMQSIPSNSGYSEQATPNTTNPFMQAQSTAFASQGAPWGLGNGSGNCTPLPQFDGLGGDFNPANTSIFQQGQTFGSTSANLFSALNINGASMTTQPQNQKKLDNGIRSHNELRRGDGIRKKNARFDIPAERNLGNIDQLIAQSTDEQEIKELKQQKRLLRNRQAALDSRQRKKQHTERLEDEKKQFTAVINEMEEEMNDLRAKMEQLLRERQGFQECIETMRLEKEEMIRAHTLESAELRKKIGVMSDHISRMETSPMTTMTGATDFHGGFDNMGAMGMAPWENVGYMGDFAMEPEVKQEAPAAPAKKEITIPSDDKSATPTGMLFMLLLVGAFVMSTRSTPNLNQVPDEMREASATVLDTMLKDAGIPPTTGALDVLAPQPSGADWNHMAMTGMQLGDSGVGSSMLTDLADSLTQPTREQMNSQAFSLSEAQYNGIANPEFLHTTPDRTSSQGRRNLAEALVAMRNGNNKQSAAEVYTRSLLWDQIPSDVVKSFVKMMAECKNAQNDQQQCTPGTS